MLDMENLIRRRPQIPPIILQMAFSDLSRFFINVQTYLKHLYLLVYSPYVVWLTLSFLQQTWDLSACLTSVLASPASPPYYIA